MWLVGVVIRRYIDILIRVSYRGGGALGYPPPRSSFLPPRISYHNVIMNQIENCTSINAYRHLATTQNASESTSENVKIKNFLGGMPPDPPSLPCFYKARVSPPKLKILYETLLIIIINFPYSTCIRSFFGSSILTSLFIF